MSFKETNLKTLISNAKEIGACDSWIAELEKYEDMSDLLLNMRMEQIAWCCGWYAENVLMARWPEAEEYIVQDVNAAVQYATQIMKSRWTPAEQLILSKEHGWMAANYAEDVIKGEWPEAEEIIATDCHGAHLYATKVINRRWYDVEILIKQNSILAKSYNNKFKCGWKETKRGIWA